MADTGETAVLAAVSGSDALFVETVESPHSVRYAAPVGKRVPLHTTATGRTLLSQMRADERAGVLRKVTFEQYTPTTLMSAEAVEAEIAQSTQRGWFQGNAEFTPELGGVSMALAFGERRFALLVAGPMYRVSHRLPELAVHIRQRIDAYLAEHAEESGS